MAGHERYDIKKAFIVACVSIRQQDIVGISQHVLAPSDRTDSVSYNETYNFDLASPKLPVLSTASG